MSFKQEVGSMKMLSQLQAISPHRSQLVALIKHMQGFPRSEGCVESVILGDPFNSIFQARV